MTHSVQVCIVNYNTREHLRTCLEGLSTESSSRPIIVVDNASPDGSAAMVQREFPDVKLIANSVNLGFGAAANQAIALCESAYMLLLNSDTRVQPGAVQALAAYLDRCPRAAIVGPKLLNSDGTLQRSSRRFPGTLAWLFDNQLGGRLARSLGLRAGKMLHAWAHDHARPVPWVIGAAMAMRVEPVRQVRGFDPGFFLYCEEIDLCMRLRKSGWEVHFTPDATIAHVGGASTPGDRRDLNRHMIASTLRLYRLHYGKLRAAMLRTLLRTRSAIAGWQAVRDTSAPLAKRASSSEYLLGRD